MLGIRILYDQFKNK